MHSALPGRVRPNLPSLQSALTTALLLLFALSSPSLFAKARLQTSYGRLPLSFEANRGQAEPGVEFLARGSGYTLALRPTEAALTLSPGPRGKGRHPRPRGARKPSLLRMKLVGADPKAGAGWGEAALPGKVNYLLGKDPRRWRRNVPTYRKVRFPGVYPGIDLVYYGNQRQLEYDFLVASGADPAKIGLSFQGAKRARVDRNGGLILSLPAGEVKLHKPLIYQDGAHGRRRIEGGYRRIGRDRFAFRVGAYDRTKPLVIDPVLVYSTTFGGADYDEAYDIAIDGQGSAYVAGQTYSTDFPLKDPYDSTYDFSTENETLFVSKINPTGTALVYSTFIGGNEGEGANAIAVDSAGNCTVAGYTFSDDLPTPNGFQTKAGETGPSGQDGYIAALNPAGSGLLYASYLGGSRTEEIEDLTFDGSGNAYVVGQTASDNFPLVRSYQTERFGSSTVFVARIAPPAGGKPAALAYSTLLGAKAPSSDQSLGRAVAVDANGVAYITGRTGDANFPVLKPFQEKRNGSHDLFVSALAPPVGDGNVTLAWSTYLGGPFTEDVAAIGLDPAGNVYLTGSVSGDGFPVKNAMQEKWKEGGGDDLFITKLAQPQGGNNLSLVYSTYMGGSSYDTASDLAVDPDGRAYLCGTTTSADFPLNAPLQDTLKGTSDAFLVRLNPQGFADFSTFFGGEKRDYADALALDSAGAIYLTGGTGSAQFPVKPAALTPYDGQSDNVFVAKVHPDLTETFDVTTANPRSGGNVGSIGVVFRGRGFQEGAQVKLAREGQADVPGQFPSVGGGVQLAATFQFSGQPFGPWDVVVTNPDGSTRTLPGGFTLEPVKASQVWVDLIGSGRARVGRQETYTLLYGNRGNTNAVAVPVWVRGIPKDAEVKLLTPLAPAYRLPEDTFDYSQIPEVVRGPDDQFIPLMVMQLPPGATGALRFSLTVHSFTPFALRAWANDPFLLPTPAAGPGPLEAEPPTPEDCLKTALSVLFAEAMNRLIEHVAPVECINESIKAAQVIVHESYDAIEKGSHGEFSGGQAMSSASRILAAGLKAGIKCGGEALQIAFPEAKIAFAVADAIGLTIDLWRIIDDCKDAFKPQEPEELPIEPVASRDPNDKAGSVGAGEGHYLSPSEPLRYTVQFENKPDATAPAQDVVVTDPLDKDKLDLSTFALGPISFGNHVVVPDSYTSSLTTDVDLRPDKPLIVRITAGVDPNTGVVTWSFHSLDPDTLQPPSDPLAGFLPPNQTPPEGEGSVLFTIQPKASLPTGTQIKNKASIVFDVNAPIETPEWLNTLDATLPVSKVDPVSDLSVSRFKVTWGGTDEGAGVADYSVFVAEENGAFVPWQAHTPDTSALYPGEPGKSYRFYSVAEDATGNREPDKAAADVTVALPADTPLIGDVNLDKQIDVGDAVEALRYVVGLSELSAVQLKAGDVNLDAQVDVSDAVDILRKVVGLDTSF